LLATGALGAPTGAALAHGDEPLTRAGLLSSWAAPLPLLAGLLALTALVLVGARAAWRRAGVGRGVRIGHLAAYAGGVGALVLALFSPLDALSDDLFSAHMVQHMLLMFVAAPLLVAANVPLAVLWALPRAWRRGLARWWVRRTRLRSAWHTLNRPALAWALFSAAMWFWHLPRFYDAALRNELVHDLEHFLFLGTALLFWWTFARLTESRAARAMLGAAYAFAALLQMGALGALLTFAGSPLYAEYADTTRAWGLAALEDQQLGGVIMWVPGHLIFLIATILVFYRWLAHASDDAPSGAPRRAPAPSLAASEPKAETL